MPVRQGVHQFGERIGVIYRVHIEAFAIKPEVREALEQAKEYRDLAKSRFTVFDGGLRYAVEHYASNPTPQLILVEEDADDDTMLQHLEQLAEVCDPETKVVVIGAVNDVNVYRHLIAQGVSEYLVTPVSARDIVECVSGIFADPSAAPRGKLIAFYGARGGVGSSVLAQNAAWGLSQALDDDVLLIDLDLPFGTAGLALNVESKQTVADVLAQPERVDHVLLERFLIKFDERLNVLPAPGDLRAMPAFDYEQLDGIFEIARQMASYVIVDMPHVWAPWVEQTLKLADEVVLVAQPDLANLRDCKNLVDTIASKRVDSTPLRLVLNRMDAYKKTQLSPKDFEETLGFEPSLQIPFDPNLFGAALNNGQTLRQAVKGNKVSELLEGLALQLSGKQAAVKRPNGLLSLLTGGQKKVKRSA